MKFRSAIGAVLAHERLFRQLTSPKAIDPGERIERPVAHCRCGGPKPAQVGPATRCARCKRAWKHEIVYCGGQRSGPRQRPPLDGIREVYADLGRILGAVPEEPREVLILWATLPTGYADDGTRERREATVIRALQVRYPRRAWTRERIREAMRLAERRVESALERAGYMGG